MKQIEDLAKAASGLGCQPAEIRFRCRTSLSVRRRSRSRNRPRSRNACGSLTERWTGLLRYAALFVLFALVYFLILNPVKGRVLAAFDSTGPRGASERALSAEDSPAGLGNRFGGEPTMVEGTAGQHQLQQATVLKQQIVTSVKADPQSATRPIQGWLRGSGAQT